MEKWLIRTERNVLRGPYGKNEVCRMIQEGELGLHDEVCRGDSYWFYLHEHLEVQSQLGIVVPRLRSPDDDETETEVDTRELSAHLADEIDDLNDEIYEIPELSEAVTENTAVLSNRALRQFRTRKAEGAVAQGAAPEGRENRETLGPSGGAAAGQGELSASERLYREVVVVGGERPSFWKGFAMVLGLLIPLLVIALVWFLKTR